jgi:hypothetical protein
MLLSNDAGFVGATWQAYQSQFDWTLPDTGGRIATLLVYARFNNASGAPLCGGGQMGDDIIYDAVPPTVSVSLASTSATAADTAGEPNTTIADLAILANDQDNGSGVERMQISPDGTFDDPTWQPFNTAITVDAKPGETIYVRVQDGSGNISPAASVTIPGLIVTPPNMFIPFVSR